MKNNEIIWREILTQFLTKKTTQFTQKELAEKYGFSFSTVFNALKPLRSLGAVDVGGRNFRIMDYEKILTYWATHRQLDKEVIYQTYIAGGSAEIEAQMTPDVTFAAYSAWKLRYGNPPADYDKVYVYARDNRALMQRFPLVEDGQANLIVWQADPFLKQYGNTVPLAQLFVDFWNLPEWYAKDYLKAVKEKLPET